jgi:hypothetical protein
MMHGLSLVFARNVRSMGVHIEKIFHNPDFYHSSRFQIGMSGFGENAEMLTLMSLILAFSEH